MNNCRFSSWVDWDGIRGKRRTRFVRSFRRCTCSNWICVFLGMSNMIGRDEPIAVQRSLSNFRSDRRRGQIRYCIDMLVDLVQHGTMWSGIVVEGSPVTAGKMWCHGPKILPWTSLRVREVLYLWDLGQLWIANCNNCRGAFVVHEWHTWL